MKTRCGLGFGLVTAMICALFIVAGVAPAAAEDTVVKIGNIIPLSGPSASVGQQGKKRP